MIGRNKGFTLVELMITLVIVAIGLALAVPSWSHLVAKRKITAAAEQVVSFVNLVQSEAVKRNQLTTLSWNSPGGHNKNWCIGATLGAAACDCTNPNTAPMCEIGDVPYLLVQSDFADINDEFLHINSQLKNSNFSFDPLRGILTNVPGALATELDAGDYLYYLHSDKGSGGTRWYEIQIRLNYTGRVTMCTDDDRQSIVAGYRIC